MKLQASPRFALRATAHLRLAQSSTFRVAGRPIERLVTPTPPALDRHRFDVCRGGDLFLSRHHRKIFAPIHGSIAGRVGPLSWRLPAGVYFSQSGHPTKNDGDGAAFPPDWPLRAAARIHRAEFLRVALSPAR